MAAQIKIGIAEDQPLAMKAILQKLSQAENITIAFTATSGEEAEIKASLYPVDIILMDIEMPIKNGIQATQSIKTSTPNIKILMLTTFDDDDKIFQAILAGASGYLLKEETKEQIITAIYNVHDGGAAMSPSIAMKALQYIQLHAAQQTQLTASILSTRETEILQLLKEGMPYKQIADQLYISEGTVRKHIENIYRKLEVNNKVSAINIATERKWL